VRSRFPHATWYGQKPTFYSVIAPEGVAASAGELVEVSEKVPDRGTPHLASPVYFIVVASRSREALEARQPTVSVFADHDDWAYNDWYSVTRQFRAGQERIAELEGGAGKLRRWLARFLK
jgi:hypothetical protein